MKKIKACLLLSLMLLSFNCFSQNSVLNITQPYGKYQVGFKVYHTYDQSRSFSNLYETLHANHNKTTYRPIQVCIWYPAVKSERKSLKYEEYFFLKAHETGEVVLTDQIKQKIVKDFIETDAVDPTILHSELRAQMKAVKDAPFQKVDKFPVIIYGPSWWSTAFENALLFEYLASHGYIVISSPSMGPVSREMPISSIGIETQARDMEFLLSQLGKIPNVDLERIAVAGFSLGGLSNVLMYARNSSVDAWIGLDPSIHEAYEFFKESPYEDYRRFSKPMLFINSMGYMNDLPFYDRLIYSDAYTVNLPNLEHTDLAAQFIKLNAPRDKEGMAIRKKGYNLMAKYFLDFLDGVFKSEYNYDQFHNEVFDNTVLDASFISLLSKRGIPMVDLLFAKFKTQNGIGLIAYLETILNQDGTTKYPEADLQKLVYLSSASQFTALSRELMKWYRLHYPDSFHSKVLEYVDSEEMLEMFIEIYGRSNSCQFSYEEINHTAHVLSMSGEGDKAIAYFELNSLLYPTDARALFNLGLGYYRIDDMTNARLNFNKSLELNPDERYRNLALDFLEKIR